MAAKRMNVLVYSGNGCTIEAVRHCVYSLRRLLSPNYAVISVEGKAIIEEPWTSSCALLVFPGGADLGYCRTLNGEGNRKISQYVERGGGYMGFCAGAYYGSRRCEFEEGNKQLEVVGDRELAFYPGVCRGLAFPGFVYHSEAGARAIELKVSKTSLTKGSLPEVFRSYYNGGGVFVDARKYRDKGVEVLASYTEDLKVDSGDGSAAVVYCKVGEGAAILACPHPEFAAVNLDHESKLPGYSRAIDALAEDDKPRTDFLMACLLKLGLKVNQENTAVPSLSRLHLSSNLPNGASDIITALQEIITIENGEEYIKDDNDTFHLENPSAWSLGPLSEALPGAKGEKTNEVGDGEDRILDYSTVVKRLIVHDKEPPASKETPYFNHHAFFANLKHFTSQTDGSHDNFGNNLMYGEVVTSTNTMLEKNTEMLRRLPSGFTATATVQVAGRGRGSNVWVSPAGSLMFSTVVRHAVSLTGHAPVVFLQYLAALAIVEGIKSYDAGYKDLPIKLKWPNDIYAVDPTSKSLVKIGGILVNSHYNASEFLSVIGIGLNTTNAAPTTSLNALKPPSPFTLEKLLARILTTFSAMYSKFVRTGFDKSFEEMYYKHWLHTDQIVTLEAEGGVKARIKGITRDWGLLLAEELGWEDRATGKIWTLQSDSNSFDFFKGLVKRKINSISLTDQFELTEATSAQLRDERSIAQRPTFLRNLFAANCELLVLNRRLMLTTVMPSHPKGGVADRTLQNGALLTAKEIDGNSATFRSHIPAVIPTTADAADPLLQDRALLTAEEIYAISVNNPVSPFLTLPQEVRNRIYKFACGENLIHIHHSTHGDLTHDICQAVVTENDNCNILDTTKNPWFASDFTNSHVICRNRNAQIGFFHRVSSAKHKYNLDLRFLRTCKQIHWEAKSIPFTSNTFSFEHPHILYALLARNPNGARVPNATLIRTVRLEMGICWEGDHKPCLDALTTIASQLKSLQRLYVDIEFCTYDAFSLKRGYPSDPSQKQFMKDLGSLRLPQLRTITLILSDFVRSTGRPILDRKQEWREYIKGALRPVSREGDSLNKNITI